MPTPTQEQLNARTQATGQVPSPIVPVNNPISVTGLQTPQTPVVVPQTPTPSTYQSSAQASLEALMGAYNAPTQQETQSTDLQNRILQSLGTLGTQKSRQAELLTQAGLPEQKTQLQGVINQLQGLQKEAAAIPLQLQQDAEGRGVTKGGLAPIETGLLRQNAIKSLGLAAIGQTLQGNIALAESTIQNALDAEFEPERQKLATLQQLYTFNKDALERTDKKKADALNIALNERTRLLGIEEANKKEIYDIGKIANQYGADARTVQKIYAAKTREEAVALAGQYLVDPKAKVELENAKLDNTLKRAQITKTQKETALLGQPTATERKEQQEALKSAETAIPLLQDKIGMIETLKNSSGLNSRVGTSIYSRAPVGFWSGVGKSITTLGIGLIGDVQDKSSGAGQQFAGGVHQLVNKETIDTLINLKERGGTLGALSDQERILLQSASSKIADWEIKKDNVGVGTWNIDEGSFKAELDTIKTLAERALVKARGSIYTPEEQAVFDSINGGGYLTAPAESYYNN